VKKIIGILLIMGLIWSITITVNKSNSDVNEADQAEAVSSGVEELPKVNFKAPSFSLRGLDEENYSLKTAKGKPLVLNFWASWCGPCKIEAPELVKLYDQYKNEFEIYAINMTANDSIEGARKFAEQFGFDFPVLLDVEGEITSKYRVVAIPTTFFVNEEGVIVDQIVGFGGADILEEKTKKLINE
jgi:cytochrome c biogenesis protein CcmG/thiol:disulfide interchange protein DsbE